MASLLAMDTAVTAKLTATAALSLGVVGTPRVGSFRTGMTLISRPPGESPQSCHQGEQRRFRFHRRTESLRQAARTERPSRHPAGAGISGIVDCPARPDSTGPT